MKLFSHINRLYVMYAEEEGFLSKEKYVENFIRSSSTIRFLGYINFYIKQYLSNNIYVDSFEVKVNVLYGNAFQMIKKKKLVLNFC